MDPAMYPQVRMAGRYWQAALFLCLVGAGCSGGGLPAKPDLPSSIAPGWTLKSYAAAPPPSGLPSGASPQCWKAEYAGSGIAGIWTCGYRSSGSAFDAMQRAGAEANTVKFQEGNFLVIARWTAGSRTDVTALIRTIQKNMQTK